MKDESNENALGRRKFLGFGIGFLGGLGLISTLGGLARKSKDTKDTKVKMLTADGKLVEIDAVHLKKAEGSPRASNEDVQRWMKKTNS